MTKKKKETIEKAKEIKEAQEIKITREYDRVIFTVGKREFFVENAEIGKIIDLNYVNTPFRLSSYGCEESMFMKKNPELFKPEAMALIEFMLSARLDLTQIKKRLQADLGIDADEEKLRGYIGCQREREKLLRSLKVRKLMWEYWEEHEKEREKIRKKLLKTDNTR